MTSRSQPSGVRPSGVTASLSVEETAAIVAKAICKSGRFETGEGTCAVLCMEALGDARAGQGCRHTSRIHGRMAADIVAALAAAAKAEAQS